MERDKSALPRLQKSPFFVAKVPVSRYKVPKTIGLSLSLTPLVSVLVIGPAGIMQPYQGL